MGLYDESWCGSCGKSQPYSEDEVICGECTSAAYETRSNQLYQYMNLHLISLEQDSVKIQDEMDNIEDLESDEYNQLEISDIYTNGQLTATRHLMSVASGILGIELKEK